MPTVERVIEAIAAMDLDPRSPAYELERATAAIEDLFRLTGQEDITGVVEKSVRAGRLTEDQGAAVLGIAVWCGNEEGASLLRTRDRWLEAADDRLRIALALGVDEVYPFRDREQMVRVLTRVSAAFPEFAERCAAWMRTRPHGA